MATLREAVGRIAADDEIRDHDDPEDDPEPATDQLPRRPGRVPCEVSQRLDRIEAVLLTGLLTIYNLHYSRSLPRGLGRVRAWHAKSGQVCG